MGTSAQITSESLHRDAYLFSQTSKSLQRAEVLRNEVRFKKVNTVQCPKITFQYKCRMISGKGNYISLFFLSFFLLCSHTVNLWLYIYMHLWIHIFIIFIMFIFSHHRFVQLSKWWKFLVICSYESKTSEGQYLSLNSISSINLSSIKKNW